MMEVLLTPLRRILVEQLSRSILLAEVDLDGILQI